MLGIHAQAPFTDRVARAEAFMSGNFLRQERRADVSIGPYGPQGRIATGLRPSQ
ncbi:hypothetical protein CE91St41_11840 [Oscillospiraceae bacterium]|nr:hypothetical protein CE91St40_25700 [Oscillospiraceae bacterium]BDF74295.1 hypothetical protein CE91St41_11840 [Oscillospiraceae bacterium]